MSSNTPNLGLLKKDPIADGNETFNIQTMLNDNWDKIDEAVGNIKVPDASLTQKGIVQLSNATDSTSEAMAATPKAVKAAYDRGSAGVSAAAAAQAKADAAETPAGAQAKANAAETNAKNASLPRSGGAMTGKLNLQTWATISGSASGYALYGSNCYLDANNKFRFENTHANLGARGFILTYGLGEGVYIFDTGPAATTAGAEFTPSLKRVLDQDDYDSLFQSVANGKNDIASAISGKGVPASGSDPFATLASKIGQISTGSRIEYSFRQNSIRTSGEYFLATLPPRSIYSFQTNNDDSEEAIVYAYVGDLVADGTRAECAVSLKDSKGIYRDVLRAASYKPGGTGALLRRFNRLEISNGYLTPGKLEYRIEYENNHLSAWSALGTAIDDTQILMFKYDLINPHENCWVTFGLTGVSYRV